VSESRQRWVVAMSGGVDSSVAAALLAQTREVVGITMDLGGTPDDAQPRRPGRCCGLPDAEDARGVARTLGIRHYTVNYRESFKRHVIDPFVADYREGRTPIPCIACNRVMKFDLLLARAEQLGAAGLATGHYARIAPTPAGAPSLWRAVDRDKDQTYFLFDTPRHALERLEFPLGGLTKPEVREIAREFALDTAEKPESQGICFIPDGDVRAALQRLEPQAPRSPGPILARDGAQLGEHSGAIGYTLGQRRGLGLSGGPWYVVEIRAAANELVVDRGHALLRSRVEVRDAVWSDEQPTASGEEVRVQVRHRQPAAEATLLRSCDRMELRFREPVWAAAPGQAAVVYDEADQRVLGGGWIAASA